MCAMPTDLRLACACGAVRGLARGVSPEDSSHIVCYCDDCRAFLQHLGRAGLLDAHGGSEIVQMSPAHLEILDGADRLACLQLAPGGMVRWYTRCCSTPVGNTLEKPTPPFVGLHPAFTRGTADGRTLDDAVGPIRARVQGRWATGDRSTLRYDRLPVRFFLRAGPMLLRWWWRGDAARSVLRDASGAPKVPPRVLTPAELALAKGAVSAP